MLVGEDGNNIEQISISSLFMGLLKESCFKSSFFTCNVAKFFTAAARIYLFDWVVSYITSTCSVEI